MKLGEIAERLGLTLRGDPQREVSEPSALETAGPESLTFVVARKYLALLRGRQPGAVIVPSELADQIEAPVLISSNPYADFARAMELFFPTRRPSAGIHPTAIIEPGATIGEGSWVGPYCVIGAQSRIGRNAVIYPHVTIYAGARIGDDFLCHSNVTIRDNVEIGNRVTIHNGAVIGSEGFGFVERDGELVKIPQKGRVVIEDDVEIGANVTIDRATLGVTIIRRGVKLDNLVHIGHNCDVGEHSRFAALSGLAGSVRVGPWCEFGGQTGCADHVKIGERVRVAAQSGIHGDLADGSTVGGTPAVDIRLWRRMSAVMHRLPDLWHRLRLIERLMGLK